MDEFKGKISKIELLSKDEYKITLDVFNDSEIEEILDFENEQSNFILHGNNYEFIIDKGSMKPVGDAEECMNVYQVHETPENLNPRLKRQWLTASIIDDISYNLITNDILKTYSTEED